jgi:hypothetical protein
MIARGMTRILTATVLLGLAWSVLALTGDEAHLQAQDKKEKNPLEGKKGTVIGTLTTKTENAIELKADGDEKARKYIPLWKGGAPAQGGGYDKEIVKTIGALTIGSRIEVDWLFQEHLRVVGIKVLKAATKDKK